MRKTFEKLHFFIGVNPGCLNILEHTQCKKILLSRACSRMSEKTRACM